MAGKVIFGPILQRNANVKPLGPNLIDILLNWISNGIYVTGIEGRKCGGDPIAIKMRLDKTRVITFWGYLERPCNITGGPRHFWIQEKYFWRFLEANGSFAVTIPLPLFLSSSGSGGPDIPSFTLGSHRSHNSANAGDYESPDGRSIELKVGGIKIKLCWVSFAFLLNSPLQPEDHALEEQDGWVGPSYKTVWLVDLSHFSSFGSPATRIWRTQGAD